MDAMANNAKLCSWFDLHSKVTLSGMLARSFLWPLVMELFHENGIQPQPDPISTVAGWLWNRTGSPGLPRVDCFVIVTINHGSDFDTCCCYLDGWTNKHVACADVNGLGSCWGQSQRHRMGAERMRWTAQRQRLLASLGWGELFHCHFDGCK